MSSTMTVSVGHRSGTGRASLPAARAVLASVFVAQRVADTVRIFQQRAKDEFSGRRGDFLGQTLKLTLGTWTNLKAPAPAGIGHAAPGL
jgi:hypothetical protein